MLPKLFVKYAEIFAAHGFPLYMVGGSTRDYLLGMDVRDFDFTTPATPEQMLSFLPEADATFSRFGVISIKDEKDHIDIVTFRREIGYSDKRHPNKVEFVTSMEEDSLRRDFTINALYIDRDGKVYDFHHGLIDLNDHVLRFIGDPLTRVKEDPLRIIRAERFAKRLGLTIEPLTKKALEEGAPLLAELNPEKITIERKKE